MSCICHHGNLKISVLTLNGLKFINVVNDLPVVSLDDRQSLWQ